MRWLALPLIGCLVAAYDLDDAKADHRARAIELDEGGDMKGAVSSFRAALRFSPQFSESYSNLAIALVDEGYDGGDEAKEQAVGLLRKALGIDSDNEAARETLGELQGSSSACTSEELVFTITGAERGDQHLESSKRRQIAKKFKECGVISVRGALKSAFLKDLKDAQEKSFRDFKKTLARTTDAEERSKGRYEVKTPLAPPFISRDLLENFAIKGLADEFLQTPRAEIDTLSSVTSLPRTPAQHWHRDAGFLFPGNEAELPPHGVVIFMPLIGVGMKNGPTEFLTKSHIPCRKSREQELKLPDLDVHGNPSGGVWTVDECPWATERFVATGKAGDAIMFDLRILHRGGKVIHDDTSIRKRAMAFFLPAHSANPPPHTRTCLNHPRTSWIRNAP